MLSLSPLLLCARSAGRKLGFVALVAPVVAFFQLSAVRVDAQGCGISGSTVTCTSNDVIQTPTNHTTPLPHSSPTVPTTNYPSTINVPYTGTVTGVQVSLTAVTSVVSPASPSSTSLFWAQAVLVSPSGKALVFLGGLGNSNDPVTNLPMVFKDGSPSAPYLGGSTSALPSGTTTANWRPTDILDNVGAGGGVQPILPGTSVSLTSSNWPQPDGSATLGSTFNGVSALGGWKLYLADWNGDPVVVNGWGLTLTIDQTAVGTTTSISGGANPATPGNNVTYTATVSSPGGTPAGTAAFTANGTIISGCSAVALSGGVAHCSVTLSAGSAAQCESTTPPAFPIVCQGAQNTIAASYSGENDSGGDYGPSSSSGLIQWVGAPTANLTHSGDQWCNSAPLYIATDANATSYPSFIPVSGYASGKTITGVSVQLNGISSVDGIFGQFLLVAPSNQNLDFLDKGFPLSANSAMNLTFIDTAGQKPNGSTPPTNGSSWEPFVLAHDIFPSANPLAPSPIPPVPGTITYPPSNSSNEFANTFNGATANGNWALYVTNQNGAETTTLANGWCITLTPSTGTPTTTSVTSSLNPAPVGQSVTYTATVKSGVNPVTSGTVTFLDNGLNPAGTSEVISLNASGNAPFSSSSLYEQVNLQTTTANVLEGDHVITAGYSGVSGSIDSSSGSILQRIDNATAISGSGQNYQACNAGGIYLGQGASGPFTPNPSIIKVAGLPGTVNSVKLTLKNLSTFGPGEASTLESLVAGPAGALDFFSKTGTITSGALTAGDYVFSDSAASSVPASTFGPGTYKPTSNAPTNDAFTSGFYTAPSFTYAAPAGTDTFASKFSNSSPNGTWGLFFNAATAMGTVGAAGGWCLNFVQNAVTVSATATHSGTGSSGNFVPSDSNAKITATIDNTSGPGPTGAVAGDPLTVTDTLDPAFTYKNSTGSDAGWTCSTSGSPVTVSCTNSNQVAQGSNSKLVINVDVSSSASGSKSNKVSVSGGGVTSITSTSDTIPIDASATLGVSLAHSGTFTQGGQAGEWDITVNNSATSSSTGTITVTDVLPTGYTLHGSSSTGSAWSCSGPGATTVTCTTSTAIGAGGSSMISLTVNVPADSATSVTNLGASVFGGGDTVHTSLGTAASSNTDTVTVVQVPASVTIDSGNSQSAAILTAFTNPLVVTVKDAGGVAIANYTPVSFAAATGTNGQSGVFSNSSALITTSANAGGQASEAITANGKAGSYSVTVTAGTAQGTFTLTTNPGPATSFVITGPDPAPFYTLMNVTVTAVDSGGNVATGYNGTVSFSCNVVCFVPANTALTNGVASVDMGFRQSGSDTFTATDTTNPGLTGTGTFTVFPGPASAISTSAPATARANSPFSFTVTAYDLSFDVATSYTGTVTFTSTDPNATLPASYTFVAGDNGTHTFQATLVTPGSQTITATDSANGFTAPTSAIDVTIPNLVVNTNVDDAGTASNCTVQATAGVNSGDSACSLRDALLEAAGQGAASISFDSTAFATAQTIAPTTQLPPIPSYVSITGPASGVTISGASQGDSPIFTVNSGSTVSLANLTVANDTTSSGGGGLTNAGTTTISNSTFTGNQATGGGAGGAVTNTGTMTISGSTFANNGATGGGDGGAIENNGTLTITYSTLMGNSVDTGGSGGAIANVGTATIVNTTVSGNTATGGGAGGGISNNSTLNIANSIVAGNSTPGGSQADISGGFTDNGGNAADGDASPTSPIIINLTPLGNYGGPMQTALPLPGSAAICAGQISKIPSGVSLDQRGLPNTNTAYAPGSTCVDAGAVQTNYAMSFTTSPPATLVSGAIISPSPVVTLTESGVIAGSATGNVAVADSAGLLTGTPSAPLSGGQATFSDLGIGLGAVGDKLTATLPLTGSIDLTADSNLFSALEAVSITPSSATFSAEVGSAFSSLAVTVTDASSAPVPGYSVVFTAPASGPSGTFAGGTTTVTVPTDVNGVADPGVFTANTIANLPGDSYTVTAQGSSLQATFTLTNTAGALTQLGLTYQPDAFTTWPVTVTVIPEDQYGNALSNFTDSLHFASSDPAAVLPPDGPLCGCSQFQATFNTTGPQTITVTDTTVSPSLPAVASFNVHAPINLVVTTSDDPTLFSTECEPQPAPGTGTGICSLRDALNEASSGLAANITFDTSKMGSTTINLVNGALEIPNDARITGPHTGSGDTLSDLITVSGNGLSGVFQMTDQTAQGAIDGIAITGGLVSDPSFAAGAAIYNNGTLWVDSSVISGNTSTSDSGAAFGGAIYSDNDLEISNSTINGNTASAGAEAIGAGIFNVSYVNASNLIVSNNTTEATQPGGIALGGGIFTGLSPFAGLDLEHSTVSVNSTLGPIDGSGDAGGGGIASLSGEMWMEYSTIAGNSSTFGFFYGGGGVYCDCYQEFYNNTITANTADTLGGGLLLDSDGIMVLSNTIISGNAGPDHPDFSDYGTPIFVGGNVVHASSINLAPLANYGGPVQTALPLPGSPAVCKGLLANIPPGETLDERGFPNVNPLYIAPDSCVDSGAVQTNYAVAFSGAPAPILPATLIYDHAPFQAAVTLSESGNPGPSGASIPLTLNGIGTLTGGSGTTAAGVANYSALKVNKAGTGNTLTATLSLNGTLSLTATSSTFAVESSVPRAVSVTPSAGFGVTQQFSFVASSPSGAGNIAAVSMLFNTSITRMGGCYLGYATAGNLLSLVSDGTTPTTSGHPGDAGILSNAQCSVDLSATTVSASDTDLTVSPTVTFKSGFTGAVLTYMYVSEISGLTTGWKKVGWWMTGATPETAPRAESVTPSSGNGTTQQFSFVASSTNGAGNIASVSMLFNTTITRVNGCYLNYAVVGNQLSLVTDGTTPTSSGHPGDAGTLSNAQCSVDLSTATISASGNELTVSPTITFLSGFAAGVHTYMYVSDVPGMSTGWRKVGWWMPGPTPEGAPHAVSMTPSSGFGTTQQFSFVASSPNGAANLVSVSMLFNTTISRINGCYLSYAVAGNQLSLVSDDGNSSTLGHPGDAETLSNSQCSVDLSTATIAASGNELTISPTITFKPGFTGAVLAYMYVSDIPGMTTGWKKVGWWMTGTTPEAAPQAVSVTPSSGYGTTQQFSFVASSQNGASNLASVGVLFNTTISRVNGCYLTYVVAGNQLSLVSDDGNSSTSGGVGTAGTLSNSQCSVDLSTATVSATGNTLTVTPTVTFSPSFMTGINIYMNVVDIPGLSTGWKKMN